jgi:small-conductance mechanosensitive channel
MLALWDAFKREGIAIPYPVRDLRFGDAARVRLEPSS